MRDWIIKMLGGATSKEIREAISGKNKAVIKMEWMFRKYYFREGDKVFINNGDKPHYLVKASPSYRYWFVKGGDKIERVNYFVLYKEE